PRMLQFRFPSPPRAMRDGRLIALATASTNSPSSSSRSEAPRRRRTQFGLLSLEIATAPVNVSGPTRQTARCFEHRKIARRTQIDPKEEQVIELQIVRETGKTVTRPLHRIARAAIG